MVAKHVKEKCLPLVSIESLMRHEKSINPAISLSDIAADESQQYVVVKMPPSLDAGEFWLALKNAVDMISVTRSNTKKDKGVSELRMGNDVNHSKNLISVQSQDKSLSKNNNHKINILKDEILLDGPWLLAREVSERAGSGSAIKNPSAVPNRWKQSKKIFAIPSEGKDLYPAYALDEGGQPLPVIKRILQIFDNTKTPWSLAFWFGSANSWLSSQKPKDLLTIKPDAVVNAAIKEKEGPIHG